MGLGDHWLERASPIDIGRWAFGMSVGSSEDGNDICSVASTLIDSDTQEAVTGVIDVVDSDDESASLAVGLSRPVAEVAVASPAASPSGTEPILPIAEVAVASPAASPSITDLVDYSYCSFSPRAPLPPILFASLLSHCQCTIQRCRARHGPAPFYIGVALNARQRWSCPWIGHNQHYRRLVVLASAPSSVTLRLEVSLIEAFRGHADLVNRAPGGGGLSPCHPTSCVYVAIGGDASRRALASEVRGRKRRWCSDVLCPGRCPACVW